MLEFPDVRETDGDVKRRHGRLLVVLPHGPAQHLGADKSLLESCPSYRDWDVVHAGPGALEAGQLHLEGEAGHLRTRYRRGPETGGWAFIEDISYRLKISSKVYRGFLGEFHLHAPGRCRARLQASQSLRQLVGHLQCTQGCQHVPAVCNVLYAVTMYL